MLEVGLGILDGIAPRRPQDDVNPLLLAVSQEGWQVDVGVQFVAQGLLAAPAFVDDDVFQTVGSGKVDVVAIGVGVHASTEGNASQHGSVPPVPGYLARTYPAGVCYLAWGTEALRQSGCQQLLVLGGDHDDAPRQGSAHIPGNIWSPFSRYEVQTVVAANFFV